MKRVSDKVIFLILVVALIALLDQVTKHLVLAHFELGQTVSIIPGLFNLTFIKNPGAAFGMFSRFDEAVRAPLLTILPLIALSAIGYLYFKLPANRSTSIAFSFVAGGAVGNLIDRVQLGWVVDWIDFHFRDQMHYPAFNFADSAICVGLGILLFAEFKNKENKFPRSDVELRNEY